MSWMARRRKALEAADLVVVRGGLEPPTQGFSVFQSPCCPEWRISNINYFNALRTSQLR
jgi:hypothetical protein